MNLRPYQQDLIHKARSLMQSGERSIIIQSPTGSGKTLLTAHMLHTAASKGMRSWFIVHRKELIEQSAKAFQLEGLNYGIISAGYPADTRYNVQIAGIATLSKRYTRYAPPSLIVWDECHHVAAKSWGSIFSKFPSAYHIGLTATPQRLDGQGLNSYFKKMIHGPNVPWLIENKFLSPYKLYAPATIDLENIPTRMGDYARDELTQVMDKPTITGSAVEHYKKYADGKRAIAFAVSVEHSKHIVEQFIQGCINAAHIDGNTDSTTRAETIKRFANGDIRLLSNVDLFGEGFDVPALEAVILLRPTKSLGLYLQQVGRSLRIFPGKSHAVILDHVGNCQRFGLPDEVREWALEGRDKKKKDLPPPVKICQMCLGAQRPSERCIFCGYIFPVSYREISQVEGELTEINQKQLALKLKYKQEQGQAKGYQDLLALAQRRGYKNPAGWAGAVWNARQKKKLMRTH